ncbi:hypothetical protein TorRG33x02_216480 [Trema orientale]|uniref:Uncharacterized protein n=1 Tax=Trema orientale TaxID=63057 RepID=A0A2P5EAJ2_TREOI|nr:hypothetical protein TorRG33x02_216480 [Trema orientale]
MTSLDFAGERPKEMWKLVAIGGDLSSLALRDRAQRDGSASSAH